MPPATGTIGNIPSFGFPASDVLGPGFVSPVPNSQQGSVAGVPPNAGVAGQSDPGGAGAVAATIAYGQQTAQQTAHHQPVFWAVAATVLGAVILGHVALVNSRG